MKNLQHLHHYQMENKIGEGGMGTVFRAVHLPTNNTVAIKALRTDMATPQMITRFRHEGQALRDLNHPNIVKMLEAIESDGHHYLVMEYVEGGSLRDLLDRTPQLPLDRVLNIALDLADALTRAHRLNIIHRDLKPANVLIANDGTPRLTDFGIARISTSDMTEQGAILGTLAYLSPEALNNEIIDERTDIWAFGVMLYEMIVGKRPFGEENMMFLMREILTSPTPDIQQLRSDLPDALTDLVYRMLEKNHLARIPSVRLVGAELEALLRGKGRDYAFNLTSETNLEPTQRLGERFATPLPAINAYGDTLPVLTTAFVARESEITELHRLLSMDDVRLITILAHGGMGKTYLSIETARQTLEPTPQFPDGVFFVALAPISSAEQIYTAIAEGTKFQFAEDTEPRQQLLNFFREKNLLLVMDNFEHVLEGATFVSAILQTAPHVKIIATSREQLNLQQETRFRLSGMDFPDWETPDDALEYAAMKLLTQSARRVRPDFSHGFIKPSR